MSVTFCTQNSVWDTCCNAFHETGYGTRFSAHLLAHAADWRPALRFMTRESPSFFEPPIGAAAAAELEGLGSYSWNLDPLNATRARALGFKTNWDLSGTFMPYDGLFLPYQETWKNLGRGSTMERSGMGCSS